MGETVLILQTGNHQHSNPSQYTRSTYMLGSLHEVCHWILNMVL